MDCILIGHHCYRDPHPQVQWLRTLWNLLWSLNGRRNCISLKYFSCFRVVASPLKLLMPRSCSFQSAQMMWGNLCCSPSFSCLLLSHQIPSYLSNLIQHYQKILMKLLPNVAAVNLYITKALSFLYIYILILQFSFPIIL